MSYKDPLDERARKSRRDWYARNKDKQSVYKKRRDKELREWFKSYKQKLKCERCEEDDPACLDFHHRDPSKKDRSVSQVFSNGWSIKRILSEIDKCDVLCANCHRKEHASIV